MQGAIDLLDSDSGIVCVVLIVSATVAMFLGRISSDAWMTYTQVIAGMLVAHKAVETWRKPATLQAQAKGPATSSSPPSSPPSSST
jgi:hypothetical protein